MLCQRPIFCRELLKKFTTSSKSVRDTCCDVIRKRRAAGAAGIGEGRKDGRAPWLRSGQLSPLAHLACSQAGSAESLRLKDLLDMMLNDVDSKTGQSMSHSSTTMHATSFV